MWQAIIHLPMLKMKLKKKKKKKRQKNNKSGKLEKCYSVRAFCMVVMSSYSNFNAGHDNLCVMFCGLPFLGFALIIGFFCFCLFVCLFFLIEER